MAANATSVDRPCARRLRDRWLGRKNGRGTAEQKNGPVAISAKSPVRKKLLVNLIRGAHAPLMLSWEGV
jgi:hypothetical protein